MDTVIMLLVTLISTIASILQICEWIERRFEKTTSIVVSNLQSDAEELLEVGAINSLEEIPQEENTRVHLGSNRL